MKYVRKVTRFLLKFFCFLSIAVRVNTDWNAVVALWALMLAESSLYHTTCKILSDLFYVILIH